MIKDKKLWLIQAGHIVLIGVYMLWYSVSVGLNWEDTLEDILADTFLIFVLGLVILLVRLALRKKYDSLMRLALVASSYYPCLFLLGFPIGSYFHVRTNLHDKGYLIAIGLAAICGTALSSTAAKVLKKKSGEI